MTAPEFPDRRSRLSGLLKKHRLEALAVSSLASVQYLTGFTGSNGLLLATAEDFTLYTDPRYGAQAAGQADCGVRVVKGALHIALGADVRQRRFHTLGFDPANLSCESYFALAKLVAGRTRLRPGTGLVESLRMIKSAAEVEAVALAARLNSAAFQSATRYLRPGVTEQGMAAKIDFQLRRLGASGPAFDTIVAFGERSALPHAQPTDKSLANNELVLVDMGARSAGYVSDMTRMEVLGGPSPRMRAAYKAVLEAQLAAIDAVRPGVTAGDVDSTARRVLRKHKIDRYFVHSTGHGLGLEIHEPPRLGRGERTTLQAGMAITIEPGVYLEGAGGIRIEDTIVVTASGCCNLTSVSKDLLVV